jgi:hypothetical protein
MKTIINKISLWVMALSLLSCVDADELATPNAAAPVLIIIEGAEFDGTSAVAVVGTFLELDKTGILDHNVGIDSIPLSGLEIKVFINHTEEVGALVTDTAGKIMFQKPWSDLGLDSPGSGNQVRLEFAGIHNDVAFRKYHSVRVK